ncbi:DUF6879 family protein [Streptomyces sp. NPDC050759]|uniref:DUF6879 family protein n=1 Tax=Streptomyces sp. NPDC050759 TaxID=3365635 RepID=UPI00378BFE10
MSQATAASVTACSAPRASRPARDRTAGVSYFSGNGAMVGHETSDDPAAAKLCSEAFTAVWDRAIPPDQYDIR